MYSLSSIGGQRSEIRYQQSWLSLEALWSPFHASLVTSVRASQSMVYAACRCITDLSLSHPGPPPTVLGDVGVGVLFPKEDHHWLRACPKAV